MDFDKIVCRKGSDALKWEALQSRWHRTDLLPLWIADMEFETPEFIVKAVQQRISHPVYGYTAKPKAWYDAIIQWQAKRNQLMVTPEMVLYVPGIVPAIAMAVQSLTEVGDRVMIQQPVYPPFIQSVVGNKRTLVNCPLILREGKYFIDFERFEQEIKGCKLFILCNPHNPGGRVWTREELSRIATICEENKVIVVSDEIHSDLTLPAHSFTSYATLSEATRQHSITLNSPSKTFNMAGLVTAYALIPNAEIRQKYNQHLCEAAMLYDGNVLSFVSVVAAYQEGEAWLKELLAYISGNIDYVVDFLQKHTPNITPIIPEASYLIFLDCRKMNLTHKQLVNFFVDKAHLALNDGVTFGQEGEGFMRINLAAPRTFLEQALNQLKEAYDSFT